MKAKLYLPIISFLFMLPVLTACNNADKNKEALTADDEIPVVKIESVSQQDVAQIETYTATVEADKINNISAAMQNRIKQILVEEGQRVAKGQKVVVMDDVNTDTYKIQVDNARANLASIKTDYNRALELYKIGGGTKQAVDQLNTQVINAQNALAGAERTLRNARENTVLTSPISGVVTARNYDPGDMTGSLPILTISQVQPVKIVINVSESELSRIHNGMMANVTFDTYGEQNFPGRVTLISPTVNTESRTFAVEVTLPNSDNKILPGMFGRVELNLGESQHVVVPDKAVVKQPGSGKQYVYVYKSNGTVEYCQVELGRRLGNSYEIVSGLPSSAQVVVSGQTRLANGKKVRLAK